jgi:hypothetical protein
MSLWPIFITGVVGVAGILGTIFVARMTTRNQTANLMLSINEERRRAQRTEKRQVYAEYLASVQGVVDSTMVAYHHKDLQNVMDAILQEVRPARSNVNTRLGELELIAGEEVTSQAQAFTDYACTSFSTVVLGIKQGDLTIAELKTADEVMEEMKAQLLKAMRADLSAEI